MSELFAALPSLEELRYSLTLVSTWRQAGVLVSGLLVALLAGQWLQRRMQPAIQPGAATEFKRIAMRTGVLVTIPLILWIWLVAGSAILRRWKGEPTELLHLAILLVGALTLIRMVVFVLRHSFSPGSKLKAWEGILTATIWVLVALHILGWLPYVEQALDEYSIMLGSLRISIYTIASFALSIALLALAALWITTAFQSLLFRSEALDDNIKIVISKLLKFVLLSLAVVIALTTAGINLTALAVFGGALGVGLGLGLQRVVSNFVSGIILGFEGSIKPGNVITVGNTFGVVQELHSRHIVVRNRDGMDILVPNESLLTTEIINWSYGDRNVRFRLPVQISYSDDPEQALAIMEKAALQTPRVLPDPAPAARLMGFGDNGIDLELRLWVNDPENGVNNVRSETYLRIWRAFRAAGITIPFPQRDVYLKPLPEAAPSRPHGKPGNRPGSGGDQTPEAEADYPD